MERTALNPEPYNALYFPCDISSVAFSLDSKYLAVAGREGLVVFQAHTQLPIFEPIARDVQKGVIILALQWIASNSIEYLCLRTQDGSLQIHCVNISPKESELVECSAETSSYMIDSFWKYKRTSRQRGNKTYRYEFGANGGYFAGVSNRSVEIYKSSSKFKPTHGFMSDFTPKVEIISKIVHQLNKIEMQQGDDQDRESNARDRSYKDEVSQSMEEDRYPSLDAAQNLPVLKRDHDEDEESLPRGKRLKQDHKDSKDRPSLASKRGRNEDEESLPGGKRLKQDHEDEEDRPSLALKRGRDEDEESLPGGKRLKQDHEDEEDRSSLTLKRGRDEDEESLPGGKRLKQDHEDEEGCPGSKRGRDEDGESLPEGKRLKQDHEDEEDRPVSKRGRDEDGEDTVDGAGSLALSKKRKFDADKENQDVGKKQVATKKSRTKKSRR
jgi:hypothetical protein